MYFSSFLTFLVDNVEFAGSDSPISAAEAAANPDVRQFAVIGGANVLVINVRNASAPTQALTLTLSRAAVAGIFNNSIINWRDPAILVENADIANWIPDANITIVVRSDSSGTTNIQTQRSPSLAGDFLRLVWTASAARVFLR
jgi:phosphate transport system substrate-binding protein